jgi:hypothetical protein
VIDRNKEVEDESDPEIEHRLKLQQQQLSTTIDNINDILDEVKLLKEDLMT